jgi:hypothetical protein
MVPIMRVLVVGILVFAFEAQGANRAGNLDPSFGNGGVAFYPAANSDGCRRDSNAIAVEPDGSIILGGTQYNDSGSRALVSIQNPRGGFLSGAFLPDTSAVLRGMVFYSPLIYVAVNSGNVGDVYAIDPRTMALVPSFGVNGVMQVAAFGDTAHHTRINDFYMNGAFFLTGTYDGQGYQQMLLDRFSIDGHSSAVSYAIYQNDNIATSLGGYWEDDGAHTIVAGYADNQCTLQEFHSSYAGNNTWTFDLDSFGWASYTYPSVSACYNDSVYAFADTGFVVAAGRVIDSTGNWSAQYQRYDRYGHAYDPARVFKMSPWGENSLRKIVIQPDGKWVMIGFTGVDASQSSGAWAGRFDANFGLPDASFGANGSTLIDFDPQDYASGQALTATMDGYGRVLLAGFESTGVSDAEGHDCTQAFIARLTTDDLIFTDGFDWSFP